MGRGSSLYTENMCEICVLKCNLGAPGWLSWLSIRLQLRSRSHGPGVRATVHEFEPRVGLWADGSWPSWQNVQRALGGDRREEPVTPGVLEKASESG